MTREKCGHCPLATEERPCHGQYNPRACVLTDRSSPDFRPGYDRILLAKGPGVLKRVANLAVAVAGHVAAGMPTATPEQQAERLAICRTGDCGYYREGDQCAHDSCGCFLVIKVGLADQRCPLEPARWGPVTGAEGGDSP